MVLIPNFKKIKFQKKDSKETDGFINLMREFHWTLDELKNLPLPTYLAMVDYFQREHKKNKK